MERCPLWRGVRCGEVSVVERCPLWRDVRCGEVSVVERCPLWRGVCCKEVSLLERCPLWASRDIKWRPEKDLAYAFGNRAILALGSITFNVLEL